MRYLILVLVAFSLSACKSTTTTKPQGPKMVWEHQAMYSEARSGIIPWATVDDSFSVDINECKMKELEVGIPSPSCSTVQAPDCSNEIGLSLSLCLMRKSYQDCNYTATNAAYDDRLAMRRACMQSKGWALVPESDDSYLGEVLIESYTSENADKLIAQIMGIENLDSLPKERKVEEIYIRWKIIHNSDSYQNGSSRYRLVARDTYFSEVIIPAHREMDVDSKREIREWLEMVDRQLSEGG